MFAKKKYIDVLDYIDLDDDNCVYYLFLGRRADGKTYSMIKAMLDTFIKEGIPSAYVRRSQEMVIAKNISFLLQPFTDYIEKKTRGKYNSYTYRNNCFRFAYKNDDNKVVTTSDPVIYTSALSTVMTQKGADKGKIRFLCFDEYVEPNGKYLTNEYTLFTNVISNFIRDRTDGYTKCVLLGNPLSKSCIYFREFGLSAGDVDKYKPNDIVDIKNKDGSITKFIYLPPVEEKKTKINKYIIDNNSENNSIVTGIWDVGNYRHLTGEQNSYSEMIASAGIEYREKYYCIEIRNDMKTDNMYLFYRPSSQEFFKKQDLRYSDNPLNGYVVLTGKTEFEQVLRDLTRLQRVFYSDNFTGNIIETLWKRDVLL